MRPRTLHRSICLGGTLLFVGFCLGCMSFNFGTRTTTETISADEVAGLQRGKAHVHPGDETIVYYPTPYASPPNLELADEVSKRAFAIVEQRADCFRVKNLDGAARDLVWKARGTKLNETATVVPVVAPALTQASATQMP